MGDGGVGRCGSVWVADRSVLGGPVWKTNPVFVAGEIAQHKSYYHATLHFGKSQAKSEPFSTFDELLSFLHKKWPGLKVKHNLCVRHKTVKDAKVIDDETLHELFRRLG
eukprot:scaffold4784_cov235-Ochromonas_danica.AAC.1